MTNKRSLAQSKGGNQRGVSPQPDPVYIPFEGDLSIEDRLTALRTRYFYLIAEAESVSREIDRLSGGAKWNPA